MRFFCFLLFTVASVTLIGCTTDPCGIYVAPHNDNTIDTVRILKGGRYINQIYRKQDKSLVYTNTGTWSLEDDNLIFDKFFASENREYGYNLPDFQDVLITTSVPLEYRWGRPVIYYHPTDDYIYLERVSR